MSPADLELMVEHMKTSIPEDAANPWCHFLDRILDLEVSIQTMTDQLSAGTGSEDWRRRCQYALGCAKKRLDSVTKHVRQA